MGSAAQRCDRCIPDLPESGRRRHDRAARRPRAVHPDKHLCDGRGAQPIHLSNRGNQCGRPGRERVRRVEHGGAHSDERARRHSERSGDPGEHAALMAAGKSVGIGDPSRQPGFRP